MLTLSENNYTSKRNIGGEPPLNSPMSDQTGMINRAWATWFRDLYKRTTFKGGNAIDENKTATDQELLEITSTLEEVIVQVNENIYEIEQNSDDIADNTQAINDNTQAINDNTADISSNASAIQANTDSIDQTNLDVAQLRSDSANTFSFAGFCGVRSASDSAIGVVDSTFKTVTGLSTATITALRAQNITGQSGLQVAIAGSWKFDVNVALTFTADASVRKFQLRIYNTTDLATLVDPITFVVPENQSGINVSFAITKSIASSLTGKTFVIQIASSSDTFASVVNVGAVFQSNNIGLIGTF